jgi:hypothetical protein
MRNYSIKNTFLLRKQFNEVEFHKLTHSQTNSQTLSKNLHNWTEVDTGRHLWTLMDTSGH